MSKQGAENRKGFDHLKQGLKSIPKTAKTMYTQPVSNVKLITKGQLAPSDNKISPGKRVGIALMGAAHVTPLGPIASFAKGVHKSIQQKNKAIKENETNTLNRGGVIKTPLKTMPLTPQQQNEINLRNIDQENRKLKKVEGTVIKKTVKTQGLYKEDQDKIQLDRGHAVKTPIHTQKPKPEDQQKIDQHRLMHGGVIKTPVKSMPPNPINNKKN